MRFDIDNFKNIEFISIKGGLTSKVYIDIDNQYFVKIPIYCLDFDILMREIYILKVLNDNKIDWCPKLLYYNDKLLITNYCGERVNETNIPDDYKIQCQKILDDLKKLNIKHNDIKKEEILVKNNKIYIVDFGWASMNDNFNCGIHIDSRKKQYIILNDSHLMNHLDYFYNKKNKSEKNTRIIDIKKLEKLK